MKFETFYKLFYMHRFKKASGVLKLYLYIVLPIRFFLNTFRNFEIFIFFQGDFLFFRGDLLIYFFRESRKLRKQSTYSELQPDPNTQIAPFIGSSSIAPDASIRNPGWSATTWLYRGDRLKK